MGVDMPCPRFSWLLEGSGRGRYQTAYRILVSSTEEGLVEDKGAMWDTGKVESGEMVNIPYGGKELKSGETYYWKVRAWDEDDQPGPWSDIGRFGMAPSEWGGKWISGKDEWSAPLLRKSFVLDDDVKEAKVFVCGLGYYELYINGEKVGDHVLDPAPTVYDKRVLYVAYDVTDYLRNGANVIGVILGNGWYSPPPLMYGRSPVPMTVYGDKPKLLLQMEAKLQNGKVTTVVSDESWKVSESPITRNDIWNGEDYDARLEKEGWNLAGYDDSAWEKAELASAPKGELDSQLMPPIKVMRTINPVSVVHPKKDVYVFDFGQNFAGWVRLHVSGPRGTKVTMKFAEEQNEDGTVNQRSLRSAEQTDTYALKGEGTEVWEPRFTYHGFRYVQIEGYPGTPALEDIEGRVVHSSVEYGDIFSPENEGGFSCSNPLFNRIHQMVLWTQTSNLYGIPTDCPQRDERMGWGGDAQLTVEEAIYNFDMAAFYTKWLNDQKDAQRKDGATSDIVPPYWKLYPGSPCWGTVYPTTAWNMYLYFKDERVLREHYDWIKRWVDFLGTRAEEYIISYGTGDWCPPKRTSSDTTPLSVTSTAQYYHDAELVSRMAEILGKTDDAQKYSELAQKIKEDFTHKFFKPQEESYSTGSQTALAIPLYFGMVPRGHEGEVIGNLIESIHASDDHFDVGIIGIKALTEVLITNDLVELMYEMMNEATFPSYGYMLENGGTTIWERWGGYTFFGPAMNSLNHIMKGTVDEWFYKGLAGIQGPHDPGGKVGWDNLIQIRPQIPENLEYCEATVRAIRGAVSVSWRKVEGSIELDVTVPVNTWAKVRIPKLGHEEIAVKEGLNDVWKNGSFVEGVLGVVSAVEDGEYIVVTIGSGSYSFISMATEFVDGGGVPTPVIVVVGIIIVVVVGAILCHLRKHKG